MLNYAEGNKKHTGMGFLVVCDDTQREYGSEEDLPELMAAMEQQNVTLVALHDRPLKTELGQYAYLIECAECPYDAYLKLTENSAFTFRYLGGFAVR